MIRVAIVEDDTASARELDSYLKRLLLENNLSHDTVFFSTADKFLSIFRKGDFDIVFMDIDMPGTNGMDAARKLRKSDMDAILIFVTNLSQYALESYDVQAFNFMVKPINYDDFAMKMGRVIANIKSSSNNKILISYKKNGCINEKIALISNIRYVEIRDHTLIWHLADGDYSGLRGESMKSLDAKLDNCGFAMCDQSFLVNIKYITSVNKEEVHIGNDIIKISRRKRQEFLSKVAKQLAGTVGSN